jgi:DNA-binding Xre family transcriptional regulator
MITSNLKYVMRKKNVTINQLIEMSGVSNHTIVRARRTSISECTLGTLERISDALECKVKDLFEQERSPHRIKKPN